MNFIYFFQQQKFLFIYFQFLAFGPLWNPVLGSVIYEKNINFQCAGQTEGSTCSSGLCYDAIHTKNDVVETGCATPDICQSSGCVLNQQNEKFICCCANRFCNGKSHRMVKARWRMYQNGDYMHTVPLVAGNMPQPRLMNPRNVAIENGNISTTTTQKIPDARPVKPNILRLQKNPEIKTTARKESVVITTTKTIPQPPTTNTPESLISEYITTTKPLFTSTSTIGQVLINSTTTTKSLSTTEAVKSTSVMLTPEPKVISITETINNVTSIKKETIPNEIMSQKLVETSTIPIKNEFTTTSNQPKNPLKPSTTEIPTVTQTTAKATNVPIVGSENLTSKIPEFNGKKNIEIKKISPPKIITETTSANSIDTSTSSTKSLPVTSAKISTFTSTETLNNENVTVTTINQRTTRSPKRISGDGRAVESYPWYWLALLGFLISSLIALMVYCSLKRCRHQQRPIRRTAGKTGEPIRTSSPNTLIQNGTKNEAKTSLLKINGHLTDESLVSRCTTITTATESTNSGDIRRESPQKENKVIKIQPPPPSPPKTLKTIPEKPKKSKTKKKRNQKNDSDDDDEQNFNGKEMSVIDPFLNKKYSGKMHNDVTTTN